VPDPAAADDPAGPLATLPQRVPRSTGLPGEPPARGSGSRARVPGDAEALRRTLGGLQRGLHAGRRDAEREITTGTGPLAPPGAGPGDGAGPGTTAHARPATRIPGTQEIQGDTDAAVAADTEEATR
jgi:hypothetical protein